MKRLYQRNELLFALCCLAAYGLLGALALPFRRFPGAEVPARAFIFLLFTVGLLRFIRKQSLERKYGLCRCAVPARRFLYWLPLAVLVSGSLWYGVRMDLPLRDAPFYLIHMLCVGVSEELIFRGLLFRALERSSVKAAVLISSITFGLGHMLNLFNGSGAELLPTLCQTALAVDVGFLFVTIFYRGGSLLPCIIAHSAINMLSVFSGEAAINDRTRLIFTLVHLIIAAAYALALMRTLPEKKTA